MTKQEIVDYVVNHTDLRLSQAIDAVECVFDVMRKSLCKGESVYVRGFATLKSYTTKERKARNISTGAAVMVPARQAVKFIPGKEMKKVLKG